jgi:hypothetical protein
MFNWFKRRNIGLSDALATAGIIIAAVVTGPVGGAIAAVVGLAAKVAQSPADYKPTPENIEKLNEEARRLAEKVQAARRK